MFSGHVALGVWLASLTGGPALPAVIGAVWLDLLSGLLRAGGVHEITPDPTAVPYLFARLDNIDWDHSLLAAAIWSLLWAAVCIRMYRSVKVGAIAALAAIAHWPTDWLVHDPDLALWPGETPKHGLGTWRALGTGAWILEAMLVTVLAVHARALRKTDRNSAWTVELILAVLTLIVAPWWTPTRLSLNKETAQGPFIQGLLLFFSFLIPCIVIIREMDRSTRRQKNK